MKKVYIIIGCDVDPDRATFVPGVTDKVLSWKGMTEGLLKTKDLTRAVRDSDDRPPIYSWCLRVDDQIHQYYDDYAWVLKEHRPLLNDLAASGDELSWHPHFWRFDPKRSAWYQETEDRDWQTSMLRTSFEAYRQQFPDCPQSARMGWNYHNTESMNTLAELGIKVDFSGVPGMRVDRSHSKIENIYDWFQAPNRPYFPSRRSHQVEAGLDESLPILEVPNLVASSLTWGIVAGLVLAKKMKNMQPLFAAVRRPRYWINISAKRQYFKPVLDQYRRFLKDGTIETIVFTNYFHADDMIDNLSTLYAFEGFKANFEDLVKTARKYDAHVRFIRARDAIHLFKSKAK